MLYCLCLAFDKIHKHVKIYLVATTLLFYTDEFLRLCFMIDHGGKVTSSNVSLFFSEENNKLKGVLCVGIYGLMIFFKKHTRIFNELGMNEPSIVQNCRGDAF